LVLVATALHRQHGLVLVLLTQIATVHVSSPLFCTSLQCLCLARPRGARGTHSLGATTSLAMPCPRGAATYRPPSVAAVRLVAGYILLAELSL
jgi:hypothetical protein